MAWKGLAEEAARKFLEELDTIRARRIKALFKIDWRDPTRYDLVLNTARTTVETAARMIAEVSQREEYQPTPESLQALKDLTITTRVEAVLIASSRLDISNLEVETRCGEVHASASAFRAGHRHFQYPEPERDSRISIPGQGWSGCRHGDYDRPSWRVLRCCAFHNSFHLRLNHCRLNAIPNRVSAELGSFSGRLHANLQSHRSYH